ncbi:MAG: hypothetical protein ACOY82_07570 [Pseudomonadota bacterium]
MSEIADIYRALAEAGIEISGEVTSDPFIQDTFFAFVPTWRDKRNRQVPSNALLSSAITKLADSGIRLRFLLTDKMEGDIEAGLRATLLHEFGGCIRNVFLTISGKAAHVWLDQKREISETERSAIRLHAGRFLETFSIAAQSIQSLTSGRVASVSVTLKLIRLFAPISQQRLADEFVKKGFDLPSSTWLSRRLDSLRKSGDIVRTDDHQYALTLSGIKRLGSSKNKQSPDVIRVLALAAGRR